jgi:Protein of unknown function (DUF3455)
MRCFTRRGRVLAAGLATVAAVGSMAATAHAGPTPPAVPDDIEVEAGNKMFLLGHATGVQIYSCNARAAGPVWEFVAPRADLFDKHGKLIIKHFGGPTWQFNDGSSVVARLVRPVMVDDTAIPWLLLERATATEGEDGARLAGTTFIQRIATKGGLAPAAALCNAVSVGARVEVPYTADYTFWKQSDQS